MTQLCANPYDLAARWFYFETAEEFGKKAKALRNDYGEPVEEFEIDFIDGEDIDAALFRAWCPHQGNFADFLTACDDWDEGEKVRVIIAVGECGYSFEFGKDQPDELDVDIYEEASLRDLAERFVDEGLFGDIPEHLQNYIDYDAIARDLGYDYTETTIAGETLIYRCG